MIAPVPVHCFSITFNDLGIATSALKIQIILQADIGHSDQTAWIPRLSVLGEQPQKIDVTQWHILTLDDDSHVTKNSNFKWSIADACTSIFGVDF